MVWMPPPSYWAQNLDIKSCRKRIARDTSVCSCDCATFGWAGHALLGFPSCFPIQQCPISSIPSDAGPRLLIGKAYAVFLAASWNQQDRALKKLCTAACLNLIFMAHCKGMCCALYACLSYATIWISLSSWQPQCQSSNFATSLAFED